jgi:EAL domain-containing protein (putative c-di-GMP-specific phosphodiesterase class I)
VTSDHPRGVTAGASAFLDALDRHVVYAYQPIVNVHTGEAYAFEALLRGHRNLGFNAIPMLFASMADVDVAVDAEMLLLDKAIRDFMHFAGDASARLFFNANNRVLNAHLEHRPHMRSILERYSLPTARFCIELSEAETLNVSRSQQFFNGWEDRPLIALDDFGTGYSGLRLLAESRPDIIKIDRFFVAGVDRSQEKRLFLEQIVSLAHSIGLSVVAEGIETEIEFQICREIGCDYVQGFFIARPTSDRTAHHTHYDIVQKLNHRNRRDRIPVGGGERHGHHLIVPAKAAMMALGCTPTNRSAASSGATASPSSHVKSWRTGRSSSSGPFIMP